MRLANKIATTCTDPVRIDSRLPDKSKQHLLLAGGVVLVRSLSVYLESPPETHNPVPE
jgi:hypothetical protein